MIKKFRILFLLLLPALFFSCKTDYIYSKPDQGGLYQKTTYYKLAIGSNGEKLIVCAGKYK